MHQERGCFTGPLRDMDRMGHGEGASRAAVALDGFRSARLMLWRARVRSAANAAVQNLRHQQRCCVMSGGRSNTGAQTKQGTRHR
ncbi:hypothetical protein VTI74DRAFT_8898 [Chaetomium olivicolor]